MRLAFFCDTFLKKLKSMASEPPMSISCVEAIVKKHVDASRKHPIFSKERHIRPIPSGIPLRYICWKCGESIVVIKASLGHSSIATTTIYASITPELVNKYLRERGKRSENANLGSSTDKMAIKQLR